MYLENIFSALYLNFYCVSGLICIALTCIALHNSDIHTQMQYAALIALIVSLFHCIIHPKSKSPWTPDSAICWRFSANFFCKFVWAKKKSPPIISLFACLHWIVNIKYYIISLLRRVLHYIALDEVEKITKREIFCHFANFAFAVWLNRKVARRGADVRRSWLYCHVQPGSVGNHCHHCHRCH